MYIVRLQITISNVIFGALLQSPHSSINKLQCFDSRQFSPYVEFHNKQPTHPLIEVVSHCGALHLVLRQIVATQRVHP